MKILLSIAAFALSLMIAGQQPESFNYQAIVHDAEGGVVSARTVSLRVSILSGSDYDSVVYMENHKVTTSQAGLVSINIGTGTDKSGSFNSIDWGSEKYFLRVEADITGGSDYKEIATTQILNVPFAAHLKSSKNPSETITEDKLFISRKYVGNFVDYRQTGPKDNNGPNLIWIKTTMDATFGKISAYGKKCEFSVGDKLYLKRAYFSPGGIFGYWVYQIENDSSVYYRLTDFQHDRKVYAETWFN
jgi:hypothetical protein